MAETDLSFCCCDCVFLYYNSVSLKSILIAFGKECEWTQFHLLSHFESFLRKCAPSIYSCNAVMLIMLLMTNIAPAYFLLLAQYVVNAWCQVILFSEKKKIPKFQRLEQLCHHIPECVAVFLCVRCVLIFICVWPWLSFSCASMSVCHILLKKLSNYIPLNASSLHKNTIVLPRLIGWHRM